MENYALKLMNNVIKYSGTHDYINSVKVGDKMYVPGMQNLIEIIEIVEVVNKENESKITVVVKECDN